MSLTIELNGEPRSVADGTTIPALLSEVGLTAHNVLVEHNGTALFRADWEGTRLAPGDRVEVIRVVAGG